MKDIWPIRRSMFNMAAMAHLAAAMPPMPSPSYGYPRRPKGKVLLQSYTKRGPGRCHRSGATKRWPFGPTGTAIAVKPERRHVYMHSAACRRERIGAWA